MAGRNRSRIALGVFLILLGAWFLAGRIFPELRTWVDAFTWPMILIAVGAFLLIFGLLVGSPGMAVPATIVAGIGGILYYQNATGDWESWAFLWTLIPGFSVAYIRAVCLIFSADTQVISATREGGYCFARSTSWSNP